MKVKKVEQMYESNADKLALEYDFEHDYEYYDYIIDSYINGQNKQVLDLFSKLDVNGKKEFIKYLNDSEYRQTQDIIDLIFDFVIDMTS